MRTPERRDGAIRRVKSFWPTELRIAETTLRVHVLNISAAGARLHCWHALAQGAACAIKLDADWIDAKIRWTDGTAFGVEFDLPLGNLSALRIAIDPSQSNHGKLW